VVASLLAKYKIDAVITDFGTAIASAFPDWAKAGLKIPVIATEDGNSVACGWKADVKTDPGFKLFTVSSQTWMVEYAVRYAVALATGGRVPSTTVVPQENFENSLTNSPHAPMCIPSLPATAINSSGLTNAQQLAALKGIVPSLASLRG
jgi:ribose transport system substrate-binding protein